MTKKWILAARSQVGPMGRGQAGRQKVYEIVVDENVVTFAWGMAEKAQRQTSRIVCRDHQSAVWAAREKMASKLERGYRLVLAA